MNETQRPRGALRSLGAVIAGLLVIVVPSIATDAVLHSTGMYPAPGQPMATGLWLLATGYRLVYGIAGCYVAARLAPDHPVRHAWILGVIGIVVGTAGVVATWNQGPGFGPQWYPIAVAVMPVACAWIGGKLGAARPA